MIVLGINKKLRQQALSTISITFSNIVQHIIRIWSTDTKSKTTACSDNKLHRVRTHPFRGIFSQQGLTLHMTHIARRASLINSWHL